MNIGLIDVDSHNFPNLALMKISAYHKSKGDYVEWYDHMSASIGIKHYEKVYVSKVFDNTYSPDIDYTPIADEVEYGGTGYNLTKNLPYEIEHIMPDYSRYGITDTAYGFLTRGCPRHCDFCIVGDKEGLRSTKVADLSEWWNGQKYIKLLDPNILACRDRSDLLEQLIESRAYVDFTQGLDIRLTNEQIADQLGRMRVKRIHFAWDNPKQDLTNFFADFSRWYKRKSSSTKLVYVLTNFNSTMEENLYRIYTLRDLGYDPYVMIYDKPNAPQEIRDMQRWVNNFHIFRKCERFEDYVPHRKRG